MLSFLLQVAAELDAPGRQQFILEVRVARRGKALVDPRPVASPRKQALYIFASPVLTPQP
jgi:hypothetical protein